MGEYKRYVDSKTPSIYSTRRRSIHESGINEKLSLSSLDLRVRVRVFPLLMRIFDAFACMGFDSRYILGSPSDFIS